MTVAGCTGGIVRPSQTAATVLIVRVVPADEAAFFLGGIQLVVDFLILVGEREVRMQRLTSFARTSPLACFHQYITKSAESGT
jgi:hypothetical protein